MKNYSAGVGVYLQHGQGPRWELTSVMLVGKFYLWCDYDSSCIEVENFNRATTSTVTKTLRIMLCWYVISDVLVSESGPQFAS